LLFKPLINVNNGSDNIIILYSIEERKNISLNLTGEQLVCNYLVVKVLDMTSSVSTDEIVSSEMTVVNEEKFIESVSILQNDEETEEQIEYMIMLAASVISDLSTKINNVGQIINAVRFISNGQEVLGSRANVFLASSNLGELVNLTIKSVDGKPLNLEENQMEKIINVIRDIVVSSTDLDLEDENKVAALKSEIDYKIVESLPHNISTQSININTGAIIDEIKMLKNGKNKANNDDDNDNDNDDEDDDDPDKF
jgi:hypothetical protein